MQAYAELETDTPGTIFGITQKPDGKSKSGNSANNETKTQGEIDSNYEKHDRSEDEYYQSKKQSDYHFYKITGLLLIVVISYNILHSDENWQKVEYTVARTRGVKIPGEEQKA